MTEERIRKLATKIPVIVKIEDDLSPVFIIGKGSRVSFENLAILSNSPNPIYAKNAKEVKASKVGVYYTSKRRKKS